MEWSWEEVICLQGTACHGLVDVPTRVTRDVRTSGAHVGVCAVYLQARVSYPMVVCDRVLGRVGRTQIVPEQGMGDPGAHTRQNHARRFPVCDRDRARPIVGLTVQEAGPSARLGLRISWLLST